LVEGNGRSEYLSHLDTRKPSLIATQTQEYSMSLISYSENTIIVSFGQKQ